MDLPYDSLIPLLDIYPKDTNTSLKRYPYQNLYSNTVHSRQNRDSTQMLIMTWEDNVHMCVHMMDDFSAVKE